MTALEQLPGRVDELTARVAAVESQLSQFREEIKGQCSATRGEIRAGDEGTCRTLRDQIRAGDEETRRTLRDEIRAGAEETRRALDEVVQLLGDHIDRRFSEASRHASVLYEEFVDRIKVIGAAGHDRARVTSP